MCHWRAVVPSYSSHVLLHVAFISQRRDVNTCSTVDKVKLQSCLPAGCEVAVADLLLLDQAHILANVISSDCHAGD